MRLEHECPVCASTARLYDVVDFNRCCEEDKGTFLPKSGEAVWYALCPHCGLLFAPDFLDWTREQFLDRIYNDDYVQVDPDYAEARPLQNASVLKEMFGAHKGRFSHLDFGGGDGHLSRLLREDGWDSTSWDPFFEPGSKLDGRKFDLITSFEVFEHCPRPHEMMQQLSSAAHDTTFVSFSTFVHDNIVTQNGRIGWWYVAPRNGHVSIFSNYALGHLGNAYGFRHGSFMPYMHCYVRDTIPDFAQHLLS